MTAKKLDKRVARALQARTGRSYQGCLNEVATMTVEEKRAIVDEDKKMKVEEKAEEVEPCSK